MDWQALAIYLAQVSETADRLWPAIMSGLIEAFEGSQSGFYWETDYAGSDSEFQKCETLSRGSKGEFVEYLLWTRNMAIVKKLSVKLVKAAAYKCFSFTFFIRQSDA